MVHQNDNIVNERRPTTKNANEFNQINDSAAAAAAAAAAAVVAVASIVTISPSLSPSPSLLLLLNKFMTTMMITTTIDAIKVQNQIKKVRTLSIVLLLLLDICFPPLYNQIVIIIATTIGSYELQHHRRLPSFMILVIFALTICFPYTFSCCLFPFYFNLLFLIP